MLAPLTNSFLMQAAAAKSSSSTLFTDDILKRLIAANDKQVAGLLQSINENNITFSRKIGYDFAALSAAYVSPGSKYYHSPLIIPKLDILTAALISHQSADGTVNIGNLESPPDTAFLMELLSAATSILIKDNAAVLNVTNNGTKKFLIKAGDALATGGVHTPNHRWVICAALARLNALFPDKKYINRIEDWLGEGIYIDADGHYPERSGIYSGVENNALTASAAARPASRGRRPGRRRATSVTVFEALHEPGGVLVYGIPEFRLPKAIVRREIDYLRAAGRRASRPTSSSAEPSRSTSCCDRTATTPSSSPPAPACPGSWTSPARTSNGVYSANEYLTRVNLMKAYRFPEYDTPVSPPRASVAVVGGGNVAMDCVRTALRLGAAKATIVYRRSRGRDAGARRGDPPRRGRGRRVPATLTNPVAFLGDEQGLAARGALHAHGARRARRLGPPPSGPDRGLGVRDPARRRDHRRRHGPQPAGAVDDARPRHEQEGLHRGGRPETLRTSKQGVFAGGDIVTGAATVILAMGAGRKAARSIHEYLTTGTW